MEMIVYPSEEYESTFATYHDVFWMRGDSLVAQDSKEVSQTVHCRNFQDSPLSEHSRGFEFQVVVEGRTAKVLIPVPNFLCILCAPGSKESVLACTSAYDRKLPYLGTAWLCIYGWYVAGDSSASTYIESPV